MINKQKIQEIEIRSFIKEFNRNTNKEIIFNDFETQEIKATLTQKDLLFFEEEFLLAFLNNREQYKIVGVDIMQSFAINIANVDILFKICQEIWDNPERFYTIDNKDNYYYDFLKYLWVEGFNKEIRLTDLVKTGNIETDIEVENLIKSLKFK
jgi:hypothetical protein